MIIKPASCQGCHGMKWGTSGFVPASGTGSNGILILGEAAGEWEAQEGMGFVGKAGMFLFQSLQRIGIYREGFKVQNVLSCQPYKNLLAGQPFEQDVINHCRPNLEATIQEMQDICRENGKTFTIITLGKVAFKAVMGFQDRDPVMQYDYICYPFWNERYKAWVIPAYHPSYLMRGQTHLLPLLQFAFQRAIEIADGGMAFQTPTLILDPPAVGFQAWIDGYFKALEEDPSLILAYDIETPMKQGTDEEEVAKEEDDDYTILRCSFCYKEDEAISVPWNAEMMSGFEQIFSKAPRLAGWNSFSYDRPRIQAQMPVVGQEIDGMFCWHVLNSSMPKGLGFVAPFYAQRQGVWKYTSDAAPAQYNAIDSLVTLQCVKGIKRDMEKQNLWPVFERHVLKVHEVFKYMSEKGVPLDLELRAKAEAQLSGILEEIEEKMSKAVPPDAKSLKVFKKTPKSTEGLVQVDGIKKVTRCPVCGGLEVKANHFKSVGKKHLSTCSICKLTQKKHGDDHPFVPHQENPCFGAKAEKIEVPTKLWAKREDFKVSKVSLIRYQEALKHQAVKSRKDNKITFDEKAIIQLVKKYPNDPLYPIILEHRSAQKLLGTYIGVTQENGKIKGGIPVGKDGRVHCEFTSNPSTLRSACQKPNLQNQPRPKGPDDPASIIRNLFVAAPGHTFIATDFGGIEAVLVGYFARAKEYIELCKIDVHSFYTSHGISALDGRIRPQDLPDVNWDKDRLKDYLSHIKKDFKTERNNLFKHLVHACVTGDHEVLTPSGWVRFDALEDGVPVAQWNNGKVSFVIPDQITRAPYQGSLYNLSTRSLSISMTPNHRVIWKNTYHSIKETEAWDFDRVRCSARIPFNGVKPGGLSENLNLLRLVAAIQADGTITSSTGIKFHLKKERKITRLKSILTDLDIPFSIKQYESDRAHAYHISFSLPDDKLFKYLSKKKDFNIEALLDLDLDSRLAFLEELPLWDGHTKRQSNGDQTCYVSTNLHNIEAAQAVGAISGMQMVMATCPLKPNYKPCYRLSINNRVQGRVIGSSSSYTTSQFNGMVYCVTVPSGAFLIRRDKKVSVTGNSNFGQSARGAQEKILLETGILYPVATIQRVMDVYHELFPKIKKWQWEMLLQVEKDGFLRNPFGYVHRFSRPFEYQYAGKAIVKKQGPDSNKIYAFLPQSTAAGIIKEAMLRLYFDRFEEAGQYLRLLIHDELFLEVPVNQANHITAIVEEEMGRPIIQMPLPSSYGMGPYLTIGTESKQGLRWGSMK